MKFNRIIDKDIMYELVTNKVDTVCIVREVKEDTIIVDYLNQVNVKFYSDNQYIDSKSNIRSLSPLDDAYLITDESVEIDKKDIKCIINMCSGFIIKRVNSLHGDNIYRGIDDIKIGEGEMNTDKIEKLLDFSKGESINLLDKADSIIVIPKIENNRGE